MQSFKKFFSEKILCSKDKDIFFSNGDVITREHNKKQIAFFMSQVYLWMFSALVITAITAYQVSQYPQLVELLFKNYVLVGILFFQLGLIFILSGSLHKISAWLYEAIFFIYAISVGVMVSGIFIIFTLDSIFLTFLITAFSYIGLSCYGYLTKRDLKPLGTFCVMGLMGLLSFSLINYAFPHTTPDVSQKAANIIGILIFAGLTAADTQWIKEQYSHTDDSIPNAVKKTEILGALALYLDFMNLFLRLLSILGKKK